MTLFDDKFPGVGSMLERERQTKNAQATKPYRLMSLSLGRPQADKDFDTEQELRDAHAKVMGTCAPFVRNAIWMEGPNGRLAP